MEDRKKFKWSKTATVQNKWKVKVFHKASCGKIYNGSKNVVFGDVPPHNFFPCYECSREYRDKTMFDVMPKSGANL